MEQFVVFMCYSSISICLFFQVLLVSLRKLKIRTISLFLILLNFQLIFGVLLILFTGNTWIIDNHIHWMGIEMLSMGPLVFIFIKGTYRSKISNKVIWHFIPLFTFLILFIGLELMAFPKSGSQFYNLFIFIIFISGSLHLLIYFVTSLLYVRKIRKILKNTYGSLKNRDLKWFSNFIFGIISIIVLELIITTLFSDKTEAHTSSFIIISFYALFIWYFTYHAFSQKKVPVVRLIDYSHAYDIEQIDHKREYVESMRGMLLRLFEDEELHRRDNLTLEDVAKELNIHEKQLSNFLNDFLGTTFHDYVNHFRVQKVIEQIKNGNGKQYTLLGMAFNAGFRSKASFNRVFKKTTGFTPSQYLKSTLK